jgi:hypothetical protein
MSNIPGEKEILTAIQKEGYAMEIRLQKKFKKKNFWITPNFAFKDQDLEKSREIDFIARKDFTIQINTKYITLNFEVLVECKYEPILVFFRTSPFTHPIEKNSFLVGNPKDIKDFFKTDNGLTATCGLDAALWFWEKNNFSPTTYSQACRIVEEEHKKKNDNNNVSWKATHQGQNDQISLIEKFFTPLFKATEYLKGVRLSEPQFNGSSPYLTYLIPLFILRGKMFEFDIDQNDEGILKEITEGVFLRGYDSRGISGRQCIHFCSEKIVEEYIDRMIRDFDNKRDCLLEHRTSLIENAEREFNERKSKNK